MFSGLTFAYPLVLLLLLLLPLIGWWYWKKENLLSPDLTFSSLRLFKGLKPSAKESFRNVPVILRIAALAFLIIAAARPQSYLSSENVFTEGIDIVMVLDISGSMLSEDFQPNRIEAAKNVISDFINGRTNDRIGLVIFSAESFTQCPLTIDYQVLKDQLKEVKSGMLTDGTAIGLAVVNGINRLKESKAKSKVIILLTDGVNNIPEMDPLTSAQIAQSYGIRMYTVGVGTNGEAPYPYMTPFGRRTTMMPVEIDENLLRQMAEVTGGQYFRATDNKKLQQIYSEIDKLEKTRVEVQSYRQAKELYYIWALIGFVLLFAELIISKIYLKRIP